MSTRESEAHPRVLSRTLADRKLEKGTEEEGQHMKGENMKRSKVRMKLSCRKNLAIAQVYLPLGSLIPEAVD